MFGVMLSVIPLALMNGFVAFLLWVYTNLLSPHVYLYGFMSDFRYAFVFAALSLGSLVLGRVGGGGKNLLDSSLIFIVIFILHAIISQLLALGENPLVEFRLEYFVKGMLVAVVAPFFVRSRWQLHMIVVVIVAGLGFHAVVDGLKVISSGGGHIIHGIPRSTLSDNNLYALAIVMILPLVLYLAKYSKFSVVKWLFFAVFALCVMAVLGSNSRGGFIAMVILGGWYWLTSARKIVSAIFVLLVAIAVVQVAPDRWFDRIETIKTANEDESFLGRVAAWKVSVNIANSNPIFGAGFDSTQVRSIWDSHKDERNFISIDIPPSVAYKAAHSNYFQVMGDLGYVGLVLFMMIMLSAFFKRWQINRIATIDGPENAWARDLATALVLSLVAFMAGGAGVSLAYFELAYLEVILLSVLYRAIRSDTDLAQPYLRKAAAS